MTVTKSDPSASAAADEPAPGPGPKRPRNDFVDTYRAVFENPERPFEKLMAAVFEEQVAAALERIAARGRVAAAITKPPAATEIARKAPAANPPADNPSTETLGVTPRPPTPVQIDDFLLAEAKAEPKRIPPFITWDQLVSAGVARFKTARNLSTRNLRDHLEALGLYTPKKNR
jgi:hypothetical protein